MKNKRKKECVGSLTCEKIQKAKERELTEPESNREEEEEEEELKRPM